MIDATIALFSILYPLLALASFAALGYKLRDLRRDRDNVALQALCAGRAATAFAYVFLTPMLYTPLDEVLGTHNIGTLLSNSCIILSALATQIMLTYWFHDPIAARRRSGWICVVFLGVVLAMISLFTLSAPPGEHPVDFEVHFAEAPEVAAYIAVYLSAYGANLVATARRTWPASSVISRPWLRRGLRLTAIGSVFVFGYLVGKSMGVIGRWAGTDALDFASVLVAPTVASAGSLVLVVGGTFPSWGQRITAYFSRVRSFKRIYPLWKALCDAVPGVALYPPGSRRSPMLVRNVELRLYRAVIEIHDCRRILQRYRDPHIEQTALEAGRKAGLEAGDLHALAEAATIKAAIRAKLEGREPYRDDDTSMNVEAHVSEELRSEVSWLESVAKALAASPLIDAARAEAMSNPMPPANQVDLG